jgi:hypothetical protein
MDSPTVSRLYELTVGAASAHRAGRMREHAGDEGLAQRRQQVWAPASGANRLRARPATARHGSACRCPAGRQRAWASSRTPCRAARPALRGQLEQHQVVAALAHLGMAEVQLVLAMRVLVVDLQHLQRRRPPVPSEAHAGSRPGAAGPAGRSWACRAGPAGRPGASPGRRGAAGRTRARCRSRAASRVRPAAPPGAPQHLARAGVEGRPSTKPSPTMRATPGSQGRARRVPASPRAWYSERGPQRGRPVPRSTGRQSRHRRTAPRASWPSGSSLPLATPCDVGELHQQAVHACGLQRGDPCVEVVVHAGSIRSQVVLSSVTLSKA